MKKKINLITLLFIFLFLISCETARDALQGKKRSEQGDEFLVNKKNPLTMPPDYDKLPEPGQLESIPKKDQEESEIKELLIIKNENNNEIVNQKTDIETSIIDKIK
tara:strand:+ start:23 stop:340 length:318 start_codon:yes stop_codon:yes gene_type:complete